MTYWRLHYHIIWATFERQPYLTTDHEKIFYGVLYGKAKELDLKIHAAGNMEDHMHIVVSIPPKLAVAECVRQLKGASSYAINHMPRSNQEFKWQEGYGALTIGERSLSSIMAYANNQKQHHGERTIMMVYEKIDEIE